MRFSGVWKSGGLKLYEMEDCQHLNEWETGERNVESKASFLLPL